MIDSFEVWWLIAWAYDYFVSRMEPEQRRDFDERLDDIRYAEERKLAAKLARIEQVRRMQENLNDE